MARCELSSAIASATSAGSAPSLPLAHLQTKRSKAITTLRGSSSAQTLITGSPPSSYRQELAQVESLINGSPPPLLAVGRDPLSTGQAGQSWHLTPSKSAPVTAPSCDGPPGHSSGGRPRNDGRPRLGPRPLTPACRPGTLSRLPPRRRPPGAPPPRPAGRTR